MFTILQLAFLIGFAVFLIAVFCLAFFRKPGDRSKTGNDFYTADIAFSPKENRYILRNKRLLPISEAVKLFFEPFDRDRWAEKKASQTGKPKDLIAEEWFLKSETARRTGIFLHEEIARYFMGSPMKGCFRFKFKGKYFDIDKEIGIAKEESLFREFVKSENLRVYRTNCLVADRSMRIAGRVAFIGICETGYEIYDWKRAGGITDCNGDAIIRNAYGRKGRNGMENVDDTPFWHYALQLNLYRAVLEKNCHITISRITLVDLCPAKDAFVKVAVPLMKAEMPQIAKYLCRV